MMISKIKLYDWTVELVNERKNQNCERFNEAGNEDNKTNQNRNWFMKLEMRGGGNCERLLELEMRTKKIKISSGLKSLKRGRKSKNCERFMEMEIWTKKK